MKYLLLLVLLLIAVLLISTLLLRGDTRFRSIRYQPPARKSYTPLSPIIVIKSVTPIITVYKPKRSETSPFKLSITSLPTTLSNSVADPPILYARVHWSTPERRNFFFIGLNSETAELEGYYVESTEALKTFPIDFLDYYRRELQARAWEETSVIGQGEWNFYTKHGSHIVFGFRAMRSNPQTYVVFVNYD